MKNQDLTLRVNHPYLSKNAVEYVTDALQSGWLSPGGPYSKRFREALQNRFGGTVILSNSGTSALEVAIMATARAYTRIHGYIIVPAYTCPDVAVAVVKAGFNPLFADVDPVRMCVTADTLKALIDNMAPLNMVIGLMAVHTYGMAVDASVYEFARAHGWFVIDDFAEGFSVTIDGHPLLDYSDAMCCSFRGDKLFPIGTGGMIATRHEAIAGNANAMIGLNSHGGIMRYHTVSNALSYEFPEVLAALGIAQLEDFDQALADRWRVINLYEKYGVPSGFIRGDAPWKYPVRVDDTYTAVNYFREWGFEVSPPFTPLHRIPLFFDENSHLPVAERLLNTLVALPLHMGVTEIMASQIALHWRHLQPASVVGREDALCV